MAGEALEIPIQATGGDAAATEIGKATRAVDTFSQHSKTAAASSATLAANTQKLSAGLGAFGGALGTIDPLLGQFGASVGRAGGAIGAMTSLIGGGPGVLFGGAVAVIGLLASAYRDSQQAAEEARKATEAKTKALEAEAAAADKTRLSLQGLIAVEQQRSAAQALATKLRLGAGSVEEQRGNLADVERRIKEATGGGNITNLDPALREELNTARQALATAEDWQRKIGDEEYLGNIGATPSDAARGGRGGAGDRRMDARLEAALMEGRGGSSSQDDIDSIMFGRGIDRSTDQTGFDDFLSNAASRGIEDGMGDVATGGGGQSKGAFATKAAEAERNAESVRAAWENAGASMVSSLAGVTAAMISGSEMSTEALLASLGEQMVGNGTNALFTGAFQLATGNPLGSTTLAIGAGWIAAGLALGATTGGGAPPGAAAARPSPGGSGGGSERDQGPTIINVYALNPNAEAGKAMEKADRMRNRRRLAS